MIITGTVQCRDHDRDTVTDRAAVPLRNESAMPGPPWVGPEALPSVPGFGSARPGAWGPAQAVTVPADGY